MIWAGLVVAGIEKLRIDDALKGSPLDLYFMPYTHSLSAAVGWSLFAFVLARRWWPNGTTAMIGLVTFSHWLTDLLVHRPDLALGFTGPKVGLALWNYPVAEMALEVGLIGLATGLWVAMRVRGRQSPVPALLFLAFLVALQIFAIFGTGATTATAIGQSALLAYGIVMLVAWLADRGKPQRSGLR